MHSPPPASSAATGPAEPAAARATSGDERDAQIRDQKRRCKQEAAVLAGLESRRTSSASLPLQPVKEEVKKEEECPSHEAEDIDTKLEGEDDGSPTPLLEDGVDAAERPEPVADKNTGCVATSLGVDADVQG